MTRTFGTRTVELLPVGTGAAVLSALPALADALTGVGPALAPYPAADATARARTTTAFVTGTPLTATEDDEGDPTALVIATSGSTGTPKGSLLSAGALAASAAATENRLGRGRWLLALPAQHIAGLQVLLRSAAAGSEPDVLDTALPFTTDRFVRAAAAMGSGPRYVSLVPTQLHRLITGPAEGAAALGSFTAVLVGGAATPAPLLQAARAAGVPVVTTYGMSETCGGCVYDGLPLDGVQVAIDEESQTIELTGPMVARGYRGMPGHAAFPRPGTFRTNDLGRLTDRLTVLGRADDVIVTGGIKVWPGPVEATLSALAGIGEVVLSSVPHEEWGQEIVAVVTGSAPALDQLRAAVTAAHGSAAAPRRLLTVDQLPTLGPGKPDRAAVRRLVLQRWAPHA